MPINYGDGGTSRPLVGVSYGDGATARAIREVWIGDNGTNRLVFSSMTATASPSSVSSATSAFSQTTGPATASASGGSGSYTYAWVKLGGDTINIDSPGTASTTFSASGLAFEDSRVATFACNVTDTSTGHVAQSNAVTVTITRTA